MRDNLDVQTLDPDLMAEIEMTANLMIAAGIPGELAGATINDALGLDR